MARMSIAGVSHQHRFLLDGVTLRAICGAHINTVLVVEASADRVPLDDEIAHGERRVLGGEGLESRGAPVRSPNGRRDGRSVSRRERFRPEGERLKGFNRSRCGTVVGAGAIGFIY